MGIFINNFSGNWQETGDSGFHPLEKTELPVSQGAVSSREQLKRGHQNDISCVVKKGSVSWGF